MKRLPVIALVLIFALSLLAPSLALAQTPVSTGPIGVLARTPIAAMTGEASEVWFIRYTLGPGAALPADRQLGWSLVAIESGALTVTSDTPLTIGTATSGATPDAALTVVPTAGQWIVLPLHAVVSARNDGPAPATFLVLLVMSGIEETIAMQTTEAGGGPEATPSGEITSQLFGAAGVEFGAGPGEMTIERAELPAGGTRDQETPNGVEVGGIERGEATLTVLSGEVLMWPRMKTSDNPSKQVVAGASVTLSANDGYSLLRGAKVRWTAADGSSFVTIRGTVAEATPGGTPIATPAS
jgi:hypothetical protein